MTLTTPQAFDQFYASISVDADISKKAETRREAVVDVVKRAFPSTSTMRYVNNTLIGSMGRNTASRPFDDIDIMVHIAVDQDLWARKYQGNSADFLYRVRTSLNSMSTVQKIGARGQAVRLFYADGLSVDVAAVVKYTTGGFGIPDGSGSWMTTDPIQHASYVTARSAELKNNLRRFVIVVKQWNKAHSSRLSSFHLEMLAARTFSSLGTNRRQALRLFFDHNSSNLSVHDPAGHSGDLSSYLSPRARVEVNQSMVAARDRADLALAAENRGDHDEAKRLWRIILGSRFPTS